MTQIQCERCGKRIEQKVHRVLCIKCSNLRDKEVAKVYREKNIDRIRERGRKYGRQKREALKREE